MTDISDYRFLKGTNKSNRLGDVLSVDFSPLKVCSHNCVYCPLGKTTELTVDRQAFHPVEEVFGEIRDWIGKNAVPDYVMLTGSGEPTLYSELGRLVELIKAGSPQTKTMLYSNASLIGIKEVRQEVSAFDFVTFNLNTVDEEVFQRICRPHDDVSFVGVIDGMKLFRKEYSGEMWIDTVLVHRVNTEEEALVWLADTVAEIGPDRYTLRLPDPPKGSDAHPKKVEISQSLRDKWRDLPFEVECTV